MFLVLFNVAAHRAAGLRGDLRAEQLGDGARCTTLSFVVGYTLFCWTYFSLEAIAEYLYRS